MTAAPMLHLADNLHLPLAWAGKAIACYAQREGGKSYLAMRFAEELACSRLQFVFFDVVGIAWSLRLDRDGKSLGYPIPVFGGHHGVPVQAHHGRALAKLIVERNLSAILDFSLMEPGGWRRFVTDFCRELLAQRQQHRGVTHCLFDEAHEFLPQSLDEEGQKEMRGAVARIVRIGRNHGLGCSLWDQRPKSVYADARTQAQLRFIGILKDDLDRNAIRKDLKDEGKEVLAIMPRLASLNTGDFFAIHSTLLGPPRLIRALPRRTFDFKPPEPGEVGPVLTDLAPLNLGELAEALAALTGAPEELDADEDWRARMSALQAQLAEARKQAAYDDASHVRVANLLVQVVRLAQEAVSLLRPPQEGVPLPPPGPVEAMRRLHEHHKRTQPKPPASPAPSVPPPVPPRPLERATSHVSTLQRLVEVLATSLREDFSRQEIGALLVMSCTGGGFNTVLKAAQDMGYLEKRSGRFRLTPAGRRAAGQVRPRARSLQEGVAAWRPHLPGRGGDVLLLLVDHPQGMHRDEVARRLGVVAGGGGFGGLVSTLRNYGLLEPRGPLKLSRAFVGAYGR